MSEKKPDPDVLEARIDAIHKEGPTKDCRDTFVSKEAFWPVKTIVYGLVTLLLTGMIVAFISLVINKRVWP